MRIIPGKTKIRIEIFKGITPMDLLIGIVFVILTVLALTSSVSGKIYIAAGLIFVGVMLIVKIGDEPNYKFFLAVIRHIAYRKSFKKRSRGKGNIKNVSAFKRIEDGIIVYDDYYGAAIEIPPVEFRFFSSYRRNLTIDESLGNVLRSLNPGFAANLVKIERKVPYDAYIENEQQKLADLRRCYEFALISEEEFKARVEVIFDRINELENLNSDTRIVSPYYYLVLFDSDKNQLRMAIDSAVSGLQRGEMKPKRLNSKELAVFLKYTNDIDFDEKEVEELEEEELAGWAMPESLHVKTNNCVINGMTSYTMAISNYPTTVGDAWMAGVMSIPATKVVVKLQPMDKSKTIRNIDRSISELRSRYNHSGVDSTLIELSEHIQTLTSLLGMLQSDNEVLLNTDVYITCYDAAQTKKEGRADIADHTERANIKNMKTIVRRAYRESDLRLSNLQFYQMEGYVGSQISAYDPLAKIHGRGIPGSTAAAMYPWIYAQVQDAKGTKLGMEEGVPVFIDLFRRDTERINSNMVIVGKSGSGKSYATKSILANLSADNSKIFVLDPENEYTELAGNLHGKFINVGNAQQGRMNPFQIITSLDDDGDSGEGNVTGSYAAHMQFLEEFFRQILPDCEKEALEYLNTLADRIYMNRGITAETNLSQLSPEDYPIFDDLYDEILKEFQSTDNEYLRALLRTLMNYVSKFSSGGRNANIWNGPSTISTDENFTVFNFQSLLSGGNQTVTNAQMLLVLKYIDNEIIKNRDYNLRYGTNRKIAVVIDEAHVFIDEKYPIALDFMFQLAKRIRKYNGMQIVITQNIKDFVGSEEISRKSSAIINACQYSMIFALSPNDMDDLCKLYEKAGGINENEQEKIVTAPRGNAFVILGAASRSSFQVDVPKDVVDMFEKRNMPSRYFSGEDGEKTWTDFLGESREKYLSHIIVRENEEKAGINHRAANVSLVEVSEEDWENEQQLAAEKISLSESLFSEPVKFTEEVRAEENPRVKSDNNSSDNPQMNQIVSDLRKMMDSMGRFSYDAMINDIMSRLGASAAGAVNSGYTQPAQPQYEPEPEEDEEDEDESDSLKFFDMLLGNDADTAVEEEDEDEEDEENEEDRTLLEYLQDMARDEASTQDIITDYSSGTEDYSPASSAPIQTEEEKLDIMSFLEKAVSEVAGINSLEDMKACGEVKRIITLNDLIELNKSRKNS